MLEEKSPSSRRLGQPEYKDESDSDINIIDELRFFYANRSKLAVYFSLFVFIGLSGLLVWRLSRPLILQGRLVLNFQGIEKGEYPDGRKFSIEDLRSTDIIGLALVDAKIAKDQAAASKLTLSVEIQPVVPLVISKRWLKQDKEGMIREDYFPNEFDVAIVWGDLPRDVGREFFEALVKRYRERAKADQLAALQIARGAYQNKYYANLLQDPNYDYEDIPRILNASADSLGVYLIQLRSNRPDATLQAGLIDMQAEVAVWSATHLETVKAILAGSGMVKNKDVAAARLRFRLDDCNMQIRQKTGELAEAFKLLVAVQKPQPLLIGQLGKEATMGIDPVTLDRLLASNYIAPLVNRISDLQHKTTILEAEKVFLEKGVGLIAHGRSVVPDSLPAGLRRAIVVASAEFERINDSYNTIVDRYLTRTTANYISIKGRPTMEREGPAIKKLLAVLILISGMLALVWVRLEAAL